MTVLTLMWSLAGLFPFVMYPLASFIFFSVLSLYCSSSCCRLICMGRPGMWKKTLGRTGK